MKFGLLYFIGLTIKKVFNLKVKTSYIICAFYTWPALSVKIVQVFLFQVLFHIFCWRNTVKLFESS